mmetsp:Transcript_64730/g.159313  ORF Transcript_64730/g.159313 Transcript_64730/m.159313 type:complete len:333 (+) Transcript_64730:196-1194(+)|eukprot:CAMPEP_0206235446 /NCGR_PEP_ID=MMETSP0047_2-20121206/13154_1 /ASSEMBLY_ACC=CAM_ASM_000192 /TAXON_ID=195065 /ORGANISM="Chroomonas mesostigmatica_cf, Strain CCMP1168" /LENGTH=332 /DNA_ID=CAMNT_0053659651 /DNA_START=196 /DNA_END=1194 /DNA_ORIENTATION=-
MDDPEVYEAMPVHDDLRSGFLLGGGRTGYTAYVPATRPSGRDTHLGWSMVASFALLLAIPSFLMSLYAATAICSTNCSLRPSLPTWLVPLGDGAQVGGEWSYDDPDSWPGMCTTGANQSPVDITTAQAVPAPDTQTTLNRKSFEIVGEDIDNDFSGMAVSYFDGHAITIDDIDVYFTWAQTTYKLTHIDFHTPSEHFIDGKQYAGEIHYVHQSLNGDRLVMAVIVEAGDNGPPFVRDIVDKTSPAEGQREIISLDFKEMLKELGLHKHQPMGYWSYEGSISKPPCTESVQWVILQQGLIMAADDLSALMKVQKRNSRPIQALNGRVMYSKKD